LEVDFIARKPKAMASSGLRHVRLSEALGALSQRKLISVRIDTSLREVLNTLNANRILSVPVMEANKGFVGMIDVLDLVRFTAFNYLASQDASVMDDNLQTAPEMFTQFEFEGNTAKEVLRMTPRGDNFHVMNEDDTLGDVAKILSSEDHRVLVGRDLNAKLFSQTDMARFIIENRTKLEPGLLDTPLRQLNLRRKVESVSHRTPTIKAYGHLLRSKVSALAVLDENHKLVGNLSASDLRGINDQNLRELMHPVHQFLARAGSKNQVIRCFHEDKLGDAINKLLENHVHRLWMTDGQGKPVGVLSLTDVIRTVLLS